METPRRSYLRDLDFFLTKLNGKTARAVSYRFRSKISSLESTISLLRVQLVDQNNIVLSLLHRLESNKLDVPTASEFEQQFPNPIPISGLEPSSVDLHPVQRSLSTVPFCSRSTLSRPFQPPISRFLAPRPLVNCSVVFSSSLPIDVEIVSHPSPSPTPFISDTEIDSLSGLTIHFIDPSFKDSILQDIELGLIDPSVVPNTPPHPKSKRRKKYRPRKKF